MTTNDKQFRDHECENGHKWPAEVVLSETTTNISGEASQYCPVCGKRSSIASPVYVKEEPISTKEAIAELLASLNVSYSVEYSGETKRDNWECDRWRVKFNKWETEYFTGTGLRKEVRGGHAWLVKTHKIVGNKWVPAKPVPPSAADVLYSLVLDSSALDMSFSDWCDTYGYDDDSLKALDIYRQCCEIAKQLRLIFKPDALAKMHELLQDY